MTIKEIKQEINKKEPNWLLIADMAKQMYLSQKQSGPFGFKKGLINVIRMSGYHNSDLIKELKDYDFNILVDTGRRFNKEVPNIYLQAQRLDKYTIVLTENSNLTNTLTQMNIPFVLYQITVRNKYTYGDNKKPMTFYIKGNGHEFKFAKGESKMQMRDQSLDSLLVEFDD